MKKIMVDYALEGVLHRKHEFYLDIGKAVKRFKVLRKMEDCYAILITYPDGSWDDFVEGIDDRDSPLLYDVWDGERKRLLQSMLKDEKLHERRKHRYQLFSNSTRWFGSRRKVK